MRSTVTRKTAAKAVIAAPLAALLLVGCSGGDSAAPAGDAPASESQGADGGDSGEITVFEDLESLNQAILDQQIEDGSLRFTTTSQGPMSGDGEGEISVAEDGTSSTSTTVRVAPEPGAPEQELEIITIPDQLFVNVGQEFEPGKPWIRVVAGGQDPFSQAFGPLVELLNNASNPLSSYKVAADAYTLVGSEQEERDGTPVVVYTVEVDTAAVLRSGLAGEEAANAPLPPGTPTTATARYVLDADNRVLETVVSSGEGDTADTTTTTYSAWGEPVEITPPGDELIATAPTG